MILLMPFLSLSLGFKCILEAVLLWNEIISYYGFLAFVILCLAPGVSCRTPALSLTSGEISGNLESLFLSLTPFRNQRSTDRLFRCEGAWRSSLRLSQGRDA